jgi:hypothetical protein
MPTQPETPLSEPQSQRVKWTYQTDRTTTDGVVFAWLLEQGNRRSGKERANEAVKAFYSAFAYRDLPGTPAALAREIAIQALWALVGRILSLAAAFDLDLMPVAAALSYSRPVTHPSGVPLPTAKALEAATQSDQAAVTPVENPDDYDSDDAMFG